MADLLRIENMSAGYGEAVVLNGINLSIAEGQTLALLGRNGTGKTTLINTIAGAVSAQQRQCFTFVNRDVDATQHHRLAITGAQIFDAQQISHAGLLRRGPGRPL